MKSTFRSILAIACIACVSVAAAATATFERAYRAIGFAWNWLRDVSPIALSKPKPKCEPILVQAKAYATKLAKRDRPTVRARWRMCPSA